MKKQIYLNDPNVASFIAWLAEHILEPKKVQLSNQFNVAKPKGRFEFDSLEDALTGYRWNFPKIDGLFENGSTFEENEVALSLLQSNLKTALNTQNITALRDGCIHVFKWGGVNNGNKEWAEDQEINLVVSVRTTHLFST